MGIDRNPGRAATPPSWDAASLADAPAPCSSPPSKRDRIPVIALTGYLGAGKTTLLNHLLRAPGARVGVVVNDFGTINVDAALLTGQVDEPAAISGGCICCMPDGGGLDVALERLARPRLHVDAIIVEASGAADPIALANLIRFSGVENVRPGGLIDVVDAVEYFGTVDTWPEPPRRFIAATLVVIAKTDLLPAHDRVETIARIATRIRSRNPNAEIVVASRGRVDPQLIFDTADSDDPADQLPLARLLREQDAAHDDDAGPSRSTALDHQHLHVRSVSVSLPEPVDAGRLVDVLESPPGGVYRMKGRVLIRGTRSEHGFLVNVVGRMIHVSSLSEPPRSGELVAIGVNLDPSSTRLALETVARGRGGRIDALGLRRLRRYQRLSL